MNYSLKSADGRHPPSLNNLICKRAIDANRKVIIKSKQINIYNIQDLEVTGDKRR